MSKTVKVITSLEMLQDILENFSKFIDQNIETKKSMAKNIKI
jgi:hypothetical protein